MQVKAANIVKKVNWNVQLRTLIDGKKVVVSEAIIRRDLHFDDVDGVECFPNADIFEELARIGYEKPPLKLTFYKAFFSAQWKFLIHTLVQCLSAKRTAWNEFSCSMASTVICLAIVVMDHQVDDVTSHNTRYTSLALTQKVFANMRRVEKGFSGVETPLFDSMLEDASKQGGKIAAIVADEGITLVDVETDEVVVSIDAESQESAAEPTVFDDEDVIMTMAQTLIKLKAKKAKLLNEQIAQKLHDEEVQKSIARDKQERADMERALEFQRQYNDKEENIDWSVVTEQVQERHLDSIKKYQNLKKKPVSIAQAMKNIIIYLKNMAAYKMEFFREMTYDKKLQRYMHDPLTWKLYTDCEVHHVSSIRGHHIFMLTEKDYPLSNVVLVLLMSGKLQVEEDNEMAIDLVMKIFMEANKPRSRSLDTSS
nr:hypothetical protein [Tanacetum cinerariifolium]